MKSKLIRFIILFSTVTLLWVQPANSQSQAVEDEGVIDVIFLGHGQREGSGYHLSHVFAPLFNRSLGREKIRMRYVEDPAILNSEDLAATDVLMIYANHAELSESQEKALLDFVDNGGGFLPLHSASWCFANSDSYTKLVGGRFQSHGYEEFTATIAEGMESHPILDGFEMFTTTDETYVHSDHNEEGREVLMYRDDEPWTWTREQGKGRVFYTAYGHDMETWGQEEFHDLLIRGILWSVGEEKEETNRQLAASLQEIEYEEADTIPNYRRQDPAPKLAKPISLAESAKLSMVQNGFELQLFVAEPDIVNPVAFAWDEKGRLFVAETVDYPNELDPGQRGNDRIIICEDKDGDGKADTFTVFAEGLNVPTSITPLDGGWIVAQAPQFLFLKDTDGDDKADLVYPISEFWGIEDTHAGPSSLRYGFDNKIWGAVGYSGVNSSTQGRFGQGVFRMDPDSGSVEPVGLFTNNTWGLGMSEDFEIFGSTANNAPAFHVPLWRTFTYERHESLPSQLAPRIADFTQFFPVTDKFLQVDAHGRYTAGAGFNLYTARTFPEQYWNKGAFIGGPTGHVLGQFFMKEKGSSYVGENRGAIMSSVDEWVAPVFAEVGPDGQLWVADWYNFIIQHNPRPTARSAGFEGKMGAGNAHINPLRDRQHGRIYRIVAKDSKPSEMLDLSNATTAELVSALSNDNMFWRMTAQRKLVREKRREAIPELRKIVKSDQSVDKIGLNTRVIHAIWSLEGLGAFSLDTSRGEETAKFALAHPSASVRKNAVMALTEIGGEKELQLASSMIDDSDSKTRLKAVLAAGLLSSSEATADALFSRRLSLPEDPWIGRAFAHAVLENEEHYVNRLLSGLDQGEVDYLSLYDKIEDVPAFLVLKRYLTSTEGSLVDALGNWENLPASSVELIGLALIDVWNHKLHTPDSAELTILQAMANRSGANTQMELKLRSAGLALSFPKIEEEAYAALVKERVFEPDIWGWGRVNVGEEIYMQNCIACHGSDATGNASLEAPSLRGMDNWYVQTQLQKFQKGIRGNHFKNPRGIAMRGALQFLESYPQPNRAITYLAHYLETLPPIEPEQSSTGNVEKGKAQYALCVACHGDAAQGNVALGAPKLTGKQDWYLFKHIEAFRNGIRGSDPRDSKGAEMAAISKAIPNEEATRDVVAYILSLNTK